MADNRPIKELPKPPVLHGGFLLSQFLSTGLRLAVGLALALDATSVLWLLLVDPGSALYWRAAAVLVRGLVWVLDGRQSSDVGTGRLARAGEFIALVVDLVSAVLLGGVWAQVARLVAIAVRGAVWWLRRPKQ